LLYVEYLPKSFECRVEGEHSMWTVVVERHWLVRSATYVYIAGRVWSSGEMRLSGRVVVLETGAVVEWWLAAEYQRKYPRW
jgi:hypothetical protein